MATRSITMLELQPHLGIGFSRVEELAGVLFLGAVGVAAAVTAFALLVLPLLPHFEGVGFGALEEQWRSV